MENVWSGISKSMLEGNSLGSQLLSRCVVVVTNAKFTLRNISVSECYINDALLMTAYVVRLLIEMTRERTVSN